MIQPPDHGLFIVVQREVAFLAKALNTIGAPQNLPFRGKRIVLSGCERSRHELIQLELDQLQSRRTLA
ncbi:MAG TPA: hypothetical protein VM820_17785, partial [Vicinamibacterales bacterium]|nr:hypothetical protein [Vicinamibacterales bacterium]